MWHEGAPGRFVSLPERRVVCPLPNQSPETMMGDLRQLYPVGRSCFSADPLSGALYVVLFHALDLLCSASCRAGCSAGGPGPPGCKVVHLLTGCQRHPPAPTPRIRACNFELKTLLRCKRVCCFTAGKDEIESDSPSPSLIPGRRAVGQPWSQWSTLAPTPRGNVEKEAFIFKKSSFRKEQWNLGD